MGCGEEYYGLPEEKNLIQDVEVAQIIFGL
jgi:hypothetical protein